jgi:hypothetical protein
VGSSVGRVTFEQHIGIAKAVTFSVSETAILSLAAN